MTALAYAPCTCGECQRLDSLPVRLHGIPHAVQPNFLRGYPVSPAPPPVAEPLADVPQMGHDDLPLFGGLEPTLF